MEPVKGGSLARVPEAIDRLFKQYNPEASPASWAIRFCASLPGVMTVLSGMSNMEQLQDNMSYMQDFQPLNDEEQAIIAQATQIISDSIAVPCTACHYCTDGCPQQIAIPEYFNVYNTLQQFPGQTNSKLYYDLVSKNHGKASECIECGQCEAQCPSTSTSSTTSNSSPKPSSNPDVNSSAASSEIVDLRCSSYLRLRSRGHTL